MDFAFTPEQRALKDSTRRLAEERIAPIAEEADESPIVHRGLMSILAESELLRYTVPEDYGGLGVRVMNLCIIREELARVSAQADTNFIMQGLGSYPITLGGTHEQKARFLPPVARGEAIAAFALTEPHAGSDVISMTTEAALDGDDWVLNGRKKFISQAGDASTYTVFAKTDPGQGSRSLSAFVVERGTPGFDDSQRLEPDGRPSQSASRYSTTAAFRRATSSASAGRGCGWPSAPSTPSAPPWPPPPLAWEWPPTRPRWTTPATAASSGSSSATSRLPSSSWPTWPCRWTPPAC